MSELVKSFSINDIKLYKEDENVDFAIAEIEALADHSNTHKNPISLDVLKEYSDTFLGKFVVAKYDKWTKDVTTHVPDEAIIGYIDPRQEIRYRTKVVDGIEKTFVVVDATLSKLYATEIVEMFRQNNHRSVSCEFSCATLYEENEDGVPIAEHGTLMYGEENPILAYSIHGITVLGLKVNPSVAGAEMSIKKFAEEAQKLVSHPMHKDEYVDVDWDGEKSKHDAIKEKDFDTMAKSIFLKLDSDYKERKIGSLHYPVMGLYDGVWKYNKNGLSSARAYGEQHDKDVAEKAIRIQKKLGLYESDDKEEKMQDEKQLESKQDDIIMSEDEKEKEISAEKENLEKEEKEMSEEEVKECSEKECADESKDIEVEETEDQKTLAEDNSKEDESEEEDDKDDVEEDDADEKEFSLGCHIEDAEKMSMLSDATDEQKDFVEKVCSMSAKEILETVLSLSKDITELKEFKEKAEMKEKELKLSAIMESVRDDLDEKQFAELSEEGKTLSIDELGGFENKVKAFAYENSKNHANVEQDDIMKFAGAIDDMGCHCRTIDSVPDQ
jgi:hypothetical protein